MDAAAVASRAARDHERRSGTSVSLSVGDTPATVPLPVKITLYRALQESLSNATRHGRCDEVTVHLTGRSAAHPSRAPGLELIVQDDGEGFDTTALASSEGLGLAGIREQTEILGGTFAVRSAPGQGAEVRVWWPIQNGGVDVQDGGLDP